MIKERYLYDNDGLKFTIKIVDILDDSIIYTIDRTIIPNGQSIKYSPLGMFIISSNGLLYTNMFKNLFFIQSEFKLVTNEINILIDKTIGYFNGKDGKNP